jgi:ribonuclease D
MKCQTDTAAETNPAIVQLASTRRSHAARRALTAATKLLPQAEFKLLHAYDPSTKNGKDDDTGSFTAKGKDEAKKLLDVEMNGANGPQSGSARLRGRAIRSVRDRFHRKLRAVRPSYWSSASTARRRRIFRY